MKILLSSADQCIVQPLPKALPDQASGEQCLIHLFAHLFCTDLLKVSYVPSTVVGSALPYKILVLYLDHLHNICYILTDVTAIWGEFYFSTGNGKFLES